MLFKRGNEGHYAAWRKETLIAVPLVTMEIHVCPLL